MTRRLYLSNSIILVLVGIICLFEVVRDSYRLGDFLGYVDAGRAVLNGGQLYDDPANTWPPFFSIFSVVLALGDNVSSYFIRFIWLLGSVVSLYYIISISVKIVFDRPLAIQKGSPGMLLQDPLIIVPLLIMLRYIMDNLANVQINIYMLLLSLLVIRFFTIKRFMWAGLILGLTISLKVYTIFLLLYFLFKREFKVVGWTLLFCLVFNLIPLVVFGFNQYVAYYDQWINEVAPLSFIPQHKNQSIFGMFLRLFTSDYNGFEMSVNVLELQAHTVKRLTYAVIGLAAIFPAYLFRKKLKDLTSIKSILEYSIVFTLIPLFSPISWKAYFIFLWLPYFVLFALLFKAKSNLPGNRLIWLKGLFCISILLIVFSSETFVGFYLSDVLEVLSCVTIATIILVFIQVYVAFHIERFDFKSIPFAKRPV